MKIYTDIAQGTPAWHRLRYGKIGGSTSKGLFVDSDTLLINMLACYLEPFELEEDSYVSSDMLRGIELEPLARKRLSAYSGLCFEEVGWIQSETIPLIGISPDGIVGSKIACEIKCPTKERHTSTLFSDCIPQDNLHQCVHYFTVNQMLETLYFCSFRPESRNPLFVKVLNRESQVNLGTKAKPVIKSVCDWSQIARANAMLLQAQIESSLTKLNF